VLGPPGQNLGSRLRDQDDSERRCPSKENKKGQGRKQSQNILLLILSMGGNKNPGISFGADFCLGKENKKGRERKSKHSALESF